MLFVSTLRTAAVAIAVANTLALAVAVVAGRQRPHQASFQPILPPSQVKAALTSCGIDSSIIEDNSSATFSADTAKFAANTAFTNATVAALPQTGQQVSDLVKCIKQENIPYAVISGGHKQDSPSQAAPPGLVISLSKLNCFSYDAHASTVEVGTGLRWGEVYSKMDEATSGSAFPLGGRVSHVGVGGSLLGGGDSWLTSLHGFANANIVKMQVVLADGQLVHVSARDRPDLFDALRGSTNQLGIVTSFTLQVWPVSRTQYSGFLAYPTAEMPQVADALNTLVDNDPSGNSNVILSIAYLSGKAFLLANTWYNGNASAAAASRAFQGFGELSPLGGLSITEPSEKSYVAVNQEQDVFTPAGRYRMNTLTIGCLDRDFLALIPQRMADLVAKYPFLNSGSAVLIEPVKTGAFDHMGTPGAVWPPSSQPFAAIIGIQLSWPDAADDDEATRATIEFRKTLYADARRYGLTAPKGRGHLVRQEYGLFPNYALLGDVSTQQLYRDQLDRLEALKARYDPQCLFYTGFVLGDNCYGAGA